MLCPRCDIGLWGSKRKQKKLKEPLPSGKKRSGRLESLSDLERALAESKETAAAVRMGLSCPLYRSGRVVSDSSLFTVLGGQVEGEFYKYSVLPKTF